MNRVDSQRLADAMLEASKHDGQLVYLDTEKKDVRVIGLVNVDQGFVGFRDGDQMPLEHERISDFRTILRIK